ncbi:hypothetical protein NPX13_g2072 [Xylaria arbuscula]|uniref:Uncharacterized protein n=1 Tax=Xylaria arbuscula TaxID=114810 RepID=A0A9W8TPI5_9PEZI|nr:hypothetical protein NPX13_g2072 [Xylaria arbuscula]
MSPCARSPSGWPLASRPVACLLVRNKIHQVTVTDLRTVAKPSLEKQGFTWLNHSSKYIGDRTPFVRKDEDHGAVRDYLEETFGLVKAAVGAQSGCVYDWRIRENGVVYENGQPATDPKTSRYYLYAPIGDVHTDFSPRGALDRIRLHLSVQEMSDAKQNGLRTILINAWRPLKTVTNAPLAMCDRRTVLKSDIVPVDKVLAENVEEETCIRHSPSQKWYYLSEQRPEEMLLFVQ